MKLCLALAAGLTTLGLMACTCAQTEGEIRPLDVKGLVATDDLVERCSSVFERMTAGHAKNPKSLGDINDMAAAITGDEPLRTVLKIDRPLAGDVWEHANDVLFQVRNNAIGIIRDEECGSTADEYLADLLFPQAFEAAVPEYESAKKYGLSYRQFLLIMLANAASVKEPATDGFPP